MTTDCRRLRLGPRVTLEHVKIHAISEDVLTEARRLAGSDEFHEIRPSEPGAPLRCCLRKAGPDETVVLFRYAPTAGAGPYAERGPVFAHLEPCPGPDHTDTFPEAFRHSPRILRAYDALGRIEAGVVAAPDALTASLDELLDREDVAQVQVRSVSHGCFLFAITSS